VQIYLKRINKKQKMLKEIYLDNAATTRVDEKVLKAMIPFFDKKYGNASSSHGFGKQAKEAIENAREIIAKSINANKEEIYFTSGGTESNNWALKELFFAYSPSGKKHIITTKIEHPSILEVCKMLEKLGAKITYLDVDNEGKINFEELEKAIGEDTLMVSIIQGNNEIGSLQDIKRIGELCRNKKVFFHIDVCQSYMKTEINVINDKIDLITLNSHKIHGPKGVGALFVRKEVKILPFMNGGGHERGMRSGTENIPAIVGFGEAVRITKKSELKKIESLRNYTINKILEISNTKLNGPNIKDKNRLCNNINISFSNIEGEAISQHLEGFGIYVSTGSACASHTLKKSHVLKAIGLNDFEINSSIRITLSKYNTKAQIDYFIDKLKIVVKKLREMSPFA
jgi:cysteine desulfurase